MSGKVKSIIDSLSIPAFVTDRKGRLESYNSAIVSLLEEEPEIGSDRWYGNATILHSDGLPMNPDENPVTLFLDSEDISKEDSSLVIVEGSDGDRRWLKIYSSWLYDDDENAKNAIHILVNITDQPQKELKDIPSGFSKKRLYEAIISSTPDLNYIFDLNYRFIFANDALLEMWGVSEDEYFGKGLRELGYEEWHAAMHERELDQVVATKVPVQGEVSFPHAKLGERFYEYIFVPILNPDGKVEAVAGTTRDITRRRAAEEALRRNEEKYRTLVENFPNGAVGLFDKDLRYTAVGGKLVDSTGVDPEDRIGNKITDIYPDEITEKVEPYFRTALNGEVNTFEVEFHGRKLLAKTLPIKDDNGEVVAGMLVVLDITERWQAQRDLRKSEEKYRSLFKSMNEGFAVIQMEFDENDEPVNFHFLETNPSYKKHSGLENVEGKSVKEVIPDLGKDMLRRNGKVALTGEPFHGEVYVDEVGRWLDLSSFRIGDPEERKVAVIFTDITERKQAQKELQSINETLEERVKERTQSLLTYQNKLRSLAVQVSKTEEKQRQQLATELHDNLGQLHALVKMKIKELQNGQFSDEIMPVVDELEKIIDKAIDYTQDLTSDLKPPPSVINDIKASMYWLAEKFADHGLTVTVDDDESPKSLDDEVKATVLQSVRELLFNIIKHTSEKKAIVRLRRKTDQLQITVEDKGDGFDLKDKELASVKDGRFGLFNILERIKLLGGHVDIEAEKSRGTKVTLYVPLSKMDNDRGLLKTAGGRQKSATMPKEIAQDQKTKVLLVDDHKMFRKGLRKIIEDEDDIMVVGEAADGEEAVALSLETLPDIILMDVSMPKMDGIEATQQIKARIPDVRIIGVSLHDSQKIMKDMRNAGASAYLPKTEAFESLIVTIRAEASATKGSIHNDQTS